MRPVDLISAPRVCQVSAPSGIIRPVPVHERVAHHLKALVASFPLQPLVVVGAGAGDREDAGGLMQGPCLPDLGGCRHPRALQARPETIR